MTLIERTIFSPVIISKIQNWFNDSSTKNFIPTKAWILLLIISVLFIAGCSTTSPDQSISKLEDRASSVESALGRSLSRISELNDEIKRLKGDLSNHTPQIASTEGKILQGDINRLKNDLSYFRNTTLPKLNGKLESFDDLIHREEGLISRLDKLDTSVRNLQGSVSPRISSGNSTGLDSIIKHHLNSVDIDTYRAFENDATTAAIQNKIKKSRNKITTTKNQDTKIKRLKSRLEQLKHSTNLDIKKRVKIAEIQLEIFKSIKYLTSDDLESIYFNLDTVSQYINLLSQKLITIHKKPSN